MPYRQDVEVGLLIGANCARAIKPREVIPGMDDDPYAMKTALGWGIIGNLSLNYSGEESEHCTCDQIISRANGMEASKTIGHFVLKTCVKEVLSPAQIGKLFELDFNEAVRDDKGLSHLDRKFLNVLRSNICHKEDGHYEVPLPLKQESLKLPNNKELAVTRVDKLKQRLQRDPKYREHYQEFMEDMIDKGHAEKVPPEEISLANGRIRYFPHHGVYHPQKPDKMRVVFDASSKGNH